MTQPPRHPIEDGLIDLGRALAYPEADPGLSGRVTAAIRAGSTRHAWLAGVRGPRLSFGVALVLLLVLVTVVAAVGLGLARIRIEIVPGDAVPSATAAGHSALGARLGRRVDMGALAAVVDFPVLTPSALRAPDAAYVDDGRVSLVWLADADLPTIEGTDVALVLTQFHGKVDEGYYEKLVHAGAARVEPVLVADAPGFWIAGELHGLVYRDGDGRPLEETRRMVGDVLIWERGDRTYRLESALGMAATIELATTIPTGD